MVSRVYVPEEKRLTLAKIGINMRPKHHRHTFFRAIQDKQLDKEIMLLQKTVRKTEENIVLNKALINALQEQNEILSSPKLTTTNN